MIYQWHLAKYVYLFNRLDKLSHASNTPLIPPIVQEIMAGSTISAKGFLTYFLTPPLPKIRREQTRIALIDLHRLVSRNAASVASNLGGGRHRHLVLTITDEEYTTQTGYVFVPPHNPGDYPPTMGTSQ